MAHDTNSISAISGLSYTLLSRQLRRDDVADVLNHRLGDVRKDKVQGRVDEFIHSRRDDDQHAHERIYDSLRKLADRYKTATAAQSTPAPAPAAAAAPGVVTAAPAPAALATSLPALVVSLFAPSEPVAPTQDAGASGGSTTGDTSSSTPSTSTDTTSTSSDSTSTSGSTSTASDSTSTSGSTTTSASTSGKSTAPGQAKR